MTYRSALTAELLDTDGVTVINDALDLAVDPKFMDELDGLGNGQISIGFYDADLTDLVDGRFVRIYTNGVEAMTFMIEGSPQYQQLGEGEEMQEVITASGRGWGAIFEGGIVAPEPLLVGVDLDTSFRHWSFASINFPNATDWDPAVERYEYQDGVAYGARVDSQVDPGADPDDPADDVVKLYPAPIGFPWPNAPKNGNGFAPTPVYDPVYWVTAAGRPSEEALGFDFHRGGFSLAGTQQVTFHGTADNLFRYFLDGVPILEELEDTLIWKGWKDVTLTLPAGFHTIGFVGENIDADVDFNPAGQLFDAIAVDVYPGDVETTLTLSLFTSGATDIVQSYYSPDTWPGWSPAQIIRDFINEVQTRGGFVQFVDDSFVSEILDSNGDEFASSDPDFTGPYIPIFSMKVFDTFLDCLNMLTEQGWLHWHCRPDTFTLDGWGGSSAVGTNTGAVFSIANGNIRALQRNQGKPYANALLVQWANGYVWVEDSAEIIAHGGRVEEGFASDAANQADAISEGVVELQRRPYDMSEAILIEIEPRDASEAPYEGFGIGDYITIPDKTGAPIVQQVLSIAPDADDDGNAFWRLEVNARWPSPQREGEDLLRAIGGKTYGAVGADGVVRI